MIHVFAPVFFTTKCYSSKLELQGSTLTFRTRPIGPVAQNFTRPDLNITRPDLPKNLYFYHKQDN
jgi:hypothetical protein